MSKEGLNPTPPPSEATKTYEGESEEGEYYGEYDWQLGEFEEPEEEPREEEKEEEEEEIYYDQKDFISKPYLSEESKVPEDVLEFDFSYGYDCKRLFNLCVVDTVVLIFASGNIIHFFDTSTGKKWYRRCFSGGGIGHITTNPVEPHVAVGEKGDNPLIIIYEWPSFEIVTILKRGTKTAYTFLNYSPNGELLCSQGGQPDYMLTIWNWKKHRIMLRSKAYGQTVFNSRFSLYVPGHLTTSGISHIKFWKINQTFTGLKLLGELGRFGKSEICNIIGFLALPDEKVVSGCEWGNILVWDAGLIRVEVFRRRKNFCHEAPITQFIYNNGELMSVAMDGTIKVWYYETIEMADPPEEDRFIEVEPIFEFEIGDYYHKAKLLLIVKADPDDSDDHTWYGQDANGGIWKLDLNMSVSARPATMVFSCHSGKVVAIQCSPFSPHFASLGEDGRIFVYDYNQKTMIMKKEFLAGGSSLLWLPLAAEESGCVLIGGFEDGVIRVMCVSIFEYTQKVRSPTDDYINLIQVLKPHTKAITSITINPKQTIIATGSEDSTIFVFQIKEGGKFVELVPIGYVPVAGGVTFCTWKPKKESTLLVSCKNGVFMEMVLPTEPVVTESLSLLLNDVPIRKQTFVSIKGEIRRNLKQAEILAQRQALIDEKREELKNKSEETGVPVDETIIEAYQEELEAEEPELPEIYIPKIPNPILFAAYMGNSICLSMGGYDAGYIYEYDFDKEGPVRYKMVADGDDIEIYAYQLYYNDKFLILGMKNGKVRVVHVNHSDRTDMSNYWSLAMHDNDNGIIRDICFNYNYSYMFTCGEDGNVFSYRFNPGNYEFKHVNIENVVSKGFPSYVCPDLDDRKAPSLEQARNKLENEERMKDANQFKRELLEVLKGMEKKMETLLKRNSRLPKSQQLSPSELILDDRIEEDLDRTLQEEMKTVKFQLAWQSEKTRLHFQKLANYFVKGVNTHAFRVHGINNKELYAEAFRLRALGDDFPKVKKLIAIKFEEQEAKGRAKARLFYEEEFVDTVTRRLNPVEGLLKQIMALVGDYKRNIKLRRLLRKYRERKDRLESRRIEWYEMAKRKPNPDKPYVEDVTAIENAKDTIGDYQLKTAPDYKVSKNAKVTTVHVFEQLLQVREKIYSIKKNYNDMVAELRQKKLDIIERHQHLRDLLLEIAKEIPKEKIRHPPCLPTYIEDIEFPEKKLTPTQAGIYEELPKRFKNIYAVESVKKQEIKLLDKEYEMLLLEKRGQKLGKVHSRLSLMKFTGITGSRDIEELEEASKDDQVMTPWEKECKKLRVIKRLYEQDGIIDEMDTDIREFDERIVQLNELKYESNVEIKFLELFVLTLHQEVLILKKFEAAENQKEAKLFEKLQEKHEIQKKMNELNAKVEGRNREIRKCEEEIKNLVTMFHAATAENKFYDFLRRIFKKKYRPPKVKSEDSDSESESESSSSSEEEEAKSLDSKEIGPIRLDETICPPGCDQHLYEWTFTQRSERHNLELNIQEEKKQIEFHKKELESLMKKVKLVDSEYTACEEDLEEFMREKQRNLNEVETVVILKLNQIQNFRSESEIENISESILFSSSRLTNLYKRVGELEKETQMERQKHEKNRQHLTRMKIDIAHMKNMIVQLAKDIDAAMIRKFGMKVDIDDIEESLLKRLVGEMQQIVFDLRRELDKKLNVVRKELPEKENEYLRKVQDNTERYNLLTVLQEEKVRLKELLQKQEKISAAAASVREVNDEKDLEKLRKVIETQDGKIKELRKEIAMLKMKAKPKPPAEQPELIERTRIKGCDGEWIEIDEITKEELKDMFGEAHEIAQDAREGELTEDDLKRMRKLTSDIVQKLPAKCREGLIRRLSHVTPQEQLSKRCAEGILEEIIRTLRTESFLEAMEVVRDIIDSIIPGLGRK